MDEFKDERKNMKDAPLKKRINNFWYYYKWYIIGGLAGLFILSTLVKDILNNKDYALYGIFVNAYVNTEDTTPFTDNFVEYSGIDTDNYNVFMDFSFRMGLEMDEAGLSTSQMIMVYSAAQDLDVIAMDTMNFNKYAYSNTFMDLRDCLTAEELAKYKDSIYYIDEAVLLKIEQAKESVDLDFTIPYPDHTKPEDMENPIPVGLTLNDSKVFNEYYTFAGEEGFVGIVTNTKRVENSVSLIKYLFD